MGLNELTGRNIIECIIYQMQGENYSLRGRMRTLADGLIFFLL